MSGFDGSKGIFEERVDTTKLMIGTSEFYIMAANHPTGEEKRMIKNAALNGVRREKNAQAEAFGDESDESQTIIQIDATRQKFARMQVYIKAWNFTLANGEALPVSYANMRRLQEEALDAIDEALDKHIEAMDRGKVVALPTGGRASSSASTSA